MYEVDNMLPKLNGVIVPHRKNTAAMPAVRMPSPKSVTIPMSMHIGAPANPCVKVGDEVVIWDNENIKLEDLSNKCDTINYEIISQIGERVPRKFI